MNQVTSGLTGDLQHIAAELSRATHRDHRRRVRRRAAARTTAIVTASVCALSGTALAAGELTGTVDLGGGHHAVPVTSTPAPASQQLPYRYQLVGVHEHTGPTRGPIYIESAVPLSSLTRAQITAGRLACVTKGQKIGNVIVWVWDSSCLQPH